MSGEAPVRYEQADGVGVITLDRPPRLNAIDQAMRTALRTLLERLRMDRSLKALVLTGAGGHFCSGGDLRDLQALAAGADSSEDRRQRLVDLQPLVQMLVHFDRPVIAAVRGVAAGGGLGLALTADFVLAADDVRFCASFARVGVVPDLGTLYTLPRLVGLQRAKELVFSAREVGAAEALRLGLALEIHAPDAVLSRALAMGRALASASGPMLSTAKRALNLAQHSDLQSVLALEADGGAIALGSAFHAEAVRRFVAKQAPMFSWPPLVANAGEETA